MNLAEIEDATLAALADIRRHWCEMRVTKGATSGTPSADVVNATDRLVSARYDVQIVLNGWCRVVMEDRPITNPKALPKGTDVLGMVTFLERHARWMSGHEAAEDMMVELMDRARLVKGYAVPQRREWMSIGSCPLEVPDEDGGMVTCGGQVRAWPEGIARVDERGGIVTEDRSPTCQKCGTEAVTSWWERVMFPEVEGHALVTADELTTLLHASMGRVVKPSTLRQWIRRGWIEASGKDEQGRTLYDRGAVVYALSRRERAGMI